MPDAARYHAALHTRDRERKYLNAHERDCFWRALEELEDLKARSFCEMLYWTGCRPSEALAMEHDHIDTHDGYAVISTLKKRKHLKGRAIRLVPIPQGFIVRLQAIHDLGRLGALWPFSRTKGWQIVRHVMQSAGIDGPKGCARGLRHSFGVQCVLRRIPESRIQAWMGHSSLETTRIYLDVINAEDHAFAARLWHGMEGAA